MNNDIKKQIQHILLDKNLSIKKLSDFLNKSQGEDKTSQNLWNKLTRGTIKYSEVLEILDLLDYEIIIQPKH